MRRAALVCVIFLACGVPSTVAAHPSPRAALQDFTCQRASNSLDRAIEVTAVMRAMTGTQRMEMKFVLLRRSAFGSPFTPVQQGDLGRWRQAAPSTVVYRVKKFVVNLPGPAAYRFRVSFRWLGTSDTRLGHMVLFSPLCYEPQ